MRIPDVFNRLKRLRLQIEQFIPQKVPITGEDLEKFSSDILLANELPDLPIYRHAIASTLMHLGPVTHRKSGRFFAKSVRRAMANQVAFEQIQKIATEEKEKLKAKDCLSGEAAGESPPSSLV